MKYRYHDESGHLHVVEGKEEIEKAKEIVKKLEDKKNKEVKEKGKDKLLKNDLLGGKENY